MSEDHALCWPINNTFSPICFQSPNLPKKLEKFKNFMKSQHKVTDESVSTPVVVFKV